TSTAIRRLTMMFGPTVNAVPVVTLKPGALAVAVITVADGRPPYCPPPYRLLRITPPGSDRPVVISAWLHPYVRGYLPAARESGSHPWCRPTTSTTPDQAALASGRRAHRCLAGQYPAGRRPHDRMVMARRRLAAGSGRFGRGADAGAARPTSAAGAGCLSPGG